MNIKKKVLVVVIALIGIIFIDTFLFPKPEESCTCTIGEEIQSILCADQCPNSDCFIRGPVYGYCRNGSCVSWVVIACDGIYSNDERTYAWFEPCWECSPM